MKLYFSSALFLWIFLLSACNKSESVVISPPLLPECDTPVIVDADLFDTAPSDEFQLLSAVIEGHCLKIVVRYGGGCEEVTFQLIDAAVVMESFPIQRNIRLSLEDNDPCEALITQELLFDLTPLQVDGNSKVVLNLHGSQESLTYQY